MAQALDYHVIVCDPREEYAEAWDVPDAADRRGYARRRGAGDESDARSAVVALTHDPKLDDMALLEALKSPAFYVGALGSAPTTTSAASALPISTSPRTRSRGCTARWD